MIPSWAPALFVVGGQAFTLFYGFEGKPALLLLKWGEAGFLKELRGGAWADRLLRAPWPKPMPLGQGFEEHGPPGRPPPLCFLLAVLRPGGMLQ